MKDFLGVVTMAYQDYDLVRRWYDYWSVQIGPENLYLLSHGNDPRHREIAAKANVINLPRDGKMYKFERRRFRAMSSVASGLLEFFHWMIVSDVDEIVIADPDHAVSVPDYVAKTYGDGTKGPKNISPLCLELVHLPEIEPLPLGPDDKILSRRRTFRPNANYSKPVLVASPATFAPGGHRNSLGPRTLPDGLFTLHLKYCDADTIERYAASRRALVEDVVARDGHFDTDHGWYKTLDKYRDILEQNTLEGVDVDLPAFRAKMLEQREKFTNQYIWGPARSDRLYRIPERFSDVF
ncbi:glycosyltransferase family 2 protein [Maribius pontilimi]|uniref:Glycosyltransferase family 2 protein n=1 Tax=Palleronia pontilimi TaxID=1964209 RepID=A0A934IAM2_9RHOB|nr:glycosyltransferase family 2 protein [Palleronia pontilimi]MBJ3762126.1 glycosyltransferase family 2 protein [Palleronia pontilimi]